MNNFVFPDWLVDELDCDEQVIWRAKLIPAFEVFVSRVEEAKRRGAKDPLRTVTNSRSGGNSRVCTKRMLDQLGFTRDERRVIFRLFAGSPSGWLGLLELFVYQIELTTEQRVYARRQLKLLVHGDLAGSHLRRGAIAA